MSNVFFLLEQKLSVLNEDEEIKNENLWLLRKNGK